MLDRQRALAKAVIPYLVLTGVMGGLIGAFLLGASPAQADEVTKTFSISGRAKVRIQTDDGGVRVSTGDIKQVQVRVEYEGYKLDKDLRVSTTQDGDTVDISAKTIGSWGFHFGVHRTNLRVEVHMPKDADLEVTSGDGGVEVDAINGSLNVHTGDGHITVQGARGDMHLRAGDGHIEGRDLDGTLEATTGDGHINVTGRFDSLNLKSGDGSVSARALAGSKVQPSWTIHTGDGSVDLEIPGELQANLEASTHDGHISLGIPVMVEGSFSSSRVQGKMNGGGGQVSIHTGDGSIHLSKT
jgi:DUF4097 and DUF4098 domain-containing protein YvlB